MKYIRDFLSKALKLLNEDRHVTRTFAIIRKVNY